MSASQVTEEVTAEQESAPRINKDAVIAVVGLGKIGLPLAAYYIRHGHHVIGCDVSAEVVAAVNSGRSHVHEEEGLEAEVAKAVAMGMLRATCDTTAAVCEAQVVVVIVPVAVTADHQVGFCAIDAASEAIGAGLHAGTLVVYETTLPVGTTAGRLRAILERTSGMVAGRDFHLAYSPERVSSRVIFRDLEIYPKVVGGLNAASTTLAISFYQSVLHAKIIRMASTDEAEFVKLIETTYRDVNIALANEYARFADEHGLDAVAAIAAANTQPYSHIHQPGVGVGGHCIPVYPYFLMSNAIRGGLELPRRARVINDGMAEYAADRLEQVLGRIDGQSILILGIAYRGNVREDAFSSAKLLRQAFAARRATVYVDDPLYTSTELEALGYLPLPPERRHEIAAIIVQSAHDPYKAFDFRPFSGCRVVLDGRRALSREEVEARGMRYMCIGDGQQLMRGHTK